MSASFAFLAGTDFVVNNLSGSGLGLYAAAGFGTSVNVGSWQGRTFITDSGGTVQGPETDNICWTHANSGIIGQSGGSVNLLKIPNYQATLNVRFTYDTAVKVQNVAAKTYDRVSSANSASGVTSKIAQLIHVTTSQSDTGSGSAAWTTFTAADAGAVSLTLAPSPGVSGLYAGNGSNSVRTDTQHDWYLAISSSPDSIGSKPYGLYVSLEYL